MESLEQFQQDEQLLGEHSSMKQLRNSINKVAQTDAAISTSGESATGNELIAQSIHQQSRRASKDAVEVNRSAIPEN